MCWLQGPKFQMPAFAISTVGMQSSYTGLPVHYPGVNYPPSIFTATIMFWFFLEKSFKIKNLKHTNPPLPFVFSPVLKDAGAADLRLSSLGFLFLYHKYKKSVSCLEPCAAVMIHTQTHVYIELLKGKGLNFKSKEKIKPIGFEEFRRLGKIQSLLLA